MHVLQGTYYAQSRCLKITEKVSFPISSEVSYIYILSSRTVLPDRTKIVGKGQKIENKKETFWVIFKQYENFVYFIVSP